MEVPALPVADYFDYLNTQAINNSPETWGGLGTVGDILVHDPLPFVPD